MPSPAIMFTAEIREIRETEGRAADPWVTLEVPIVRASVNKKDGHIFFRTTYEEPRRIPSMGDLSFYFMGTPVLHFRYGGEIGDLAKSAVANSTAVIPTVRLAASDGPPSASQDFGADFAGHAELPDEKWVQLNSTTDRFTLQVRLRKMPPLAPLGWAQSLSLADSHVYYVYGVDSLIVHVNQKGALTGAAAAPLGDKDRVLAI
jgi:hypothetical protein